MNDPAEAISQQEKRNIPMKINVAVALLVLVMPACQRSGGDGAAAFPDRPVTLVVGYSAGGTVDTAARGIQPYLQKALGATVIIENKPGSSSLIAANYVAAARPDGYTLMIGTNATIMNSQIYPDSWKSGKSFIDSFVPVYSWVNADGNAIAVRRDSPLNSMEDLSAEAGKRAVKLCIAGGLGSGDHFTTVALRKAYGGNWIIVPMDSGAEATAAVLGGKCDASSASPAGASMDTNALKLLAVTMEKRTPRWPDAPTFAELGKPEVTFNFVIGAMAPVGTPPEIIAKLEAAFDTARHDADFIAWAEQTNQPIGEQGWDARTFSDFLQRAIAGSQGIIPDLREDIRKAQQGN
ncbi:MAG: Bug family tripartite tricarboxylate transporter substrate binding protein [Terriglobia bacterium]